MEQPDVGGPLASRPGGAQELEVPGQSSRVVHEGDPVGALAPPAGRSPERDPGVIAHFHRTWAELSHLQLVALGCPEVVTTNDDSLCEASFEPRTPRLNE